MADNSEEPLISIAQAAAKIGINRSTLARQIKDGSVRKNAEKVRLSEVIADRLRNVDLGRSERWRGKIDSDAGLPRPPVQPAVHATLADASCNRVDASCNARRATVPSSAQEADRLITVGRAAKALGIDRSVLWEMVRSGAVRSRHGRVSLLEVRAAACPAAHHGPENAPSQASQRRPTPSLQKEI